MRCSALLLWPNMPRYMQYTVDLKLLYANFSCYRDLLWWVVVKFYLGITLNGEKNIIHFVAVTHSCFINNNIQMSFCYKIEDL